MDVLQTPDTRRPPLSRIRIATPLAILAVAWPFAVAMAFSAIMSWTKNYEYWPDRYVLVLHAASFLTVFPASISCYLAISLFTPKEIAVAVSLLLGLVAGFASVLIAVFFTMWIQLG